MSNYFVQLTKVNKCKVRVRIIGVSLITLLLVRWGSSEAELASRGGFDGWSSCCYVLVPFVVCPEGRRGQIWWLGGELNHGLWFPIRFFLWLLAGEVNHLLGWADLDFLFLIRQPIEGLRKSGLSHFLTGWAKNWKGGVRIDIWLIEGKDGGAICGAIFTSFLEGGTVRTIFITLRNGFFSWPGAFSKAKNHSSRSTKSSNIPLICLSTMWVTQGGNGADRSIRWGGILSNSALPSQ